MATARHADIEMLRLQIGSKIRVGSLAGSVVVEAGEGRHLKHIHVEMMAQR